MMVPYNQRIAVTGVGIVSALGTDADTTFRRLIAGERAFSPITLFDTAGQRTRIAAEVSGVSVADVAPVHELGAWSRSDALAAVAAREAVAAARLPAAARLALAVGATTGGMFEAEDVLASMRESASAESMRRLLAYPLSTSADHIAHALGNVGRRVTICSACSSGAIALVQAASFIATGEADVVIAGGTDALCRLTLTGFNALGATSIEGARPFDRARDGLTLGEGAAFLVLEPETHARERGAEVLAWLSGWSVAAEAHHITHPEPDGATAARLIRGALEQAGLSPADVDYVNAHGTGTQANDAMESRALHTALGPDVERVWVSSSKGQIGHTLGAAGALEAAITVLALSRGELPPTGGLAHPDASWPLRHLTGGHHRQPLRAALSSSFGFGGTGAVLALEHPSQPDRRARTATLPKRLVTAAVTIGDSGIITGLDNALHAGSERVPAAEKLEPLAELDPARTRRFDRASALVTLGATRALASAGLSPSGVGLVAGTAFGNVERSVAFLRRLFERGPRFASPAEFPHLVPSAPSGNASIYAGLSGPVVSVSDLATSAEAAVEVACAFVTLGLAPAVIAGSAEPEDEIVARVLGPMHADRPPAADEGSGWLVIESDASARARGAKVLAEIVAFASNASELAAPRAPERALVVMARSDEGDSVLAGSAWHAAQRSPLAPHVGRHEARGAYALAAAAALIAAGRADEALAVGRERERLHLVHLMRWPDAA